MAFFDISLDELRTYCPARTEPADFDSFWKLTLEEARAHPLNATFERVDYGLSAQEMFDVTYAGFGGQPIKGWLILPVGAKQPLPCVVEYIGYQRTDQEHQPRRKAVGDGQQGEDQRAHDEAELQRRGQRAQRHRGPAEFTLQVGHDRVDGEPQRGTGELGEHQHRQHVARNGGLGVVQGGQGGLLAAPGGAGFLSVLWPRTLGQGAGRRLSGLRQ